MAEVQEAAPIFTSIWRYLFNFYNDMYSLACNDCTICKAGNDCTFLHASSKLGMQHHDF